jgi:hypothetical protein
MQDTEEEEDEEAQSAEDEEIQKQRENQFLRDIFVAAGGGGSTLNFYFDMFSTKEHVVKNAEPVVVWWMARTHPYVKRLMDIRTAVWKQERRLIFTPYRPHSNIYGFPENIVENLVDRCIRLLSEYGIVRVQAEEEGEEEEQRKEGDQGCQKEELILETPEAPPAEQTSAVEKSSVI